MKRFVLALAAVVSALVVAFPAYAAPANTVNISFRGQSANAFFGSVDPSGCIETFVSVFAVDGRARQDGAPQVESLANVFIFRVDQCAGTTLLDADGSATLAPDEFVIDKALTSAALETTVTVTDLLSGRSFPVEVALTWTGTGDALRRKEHVQIKGPGFMVNRTFDGTSREATASGTVSDGTTNFTPEPGGGNLESVRSGLLRIER